MEDKLSLSKTRFTPTRPYSTYQNPSTNAKTSTAFIPTTPAPQTIIGLLPTPKPSPPFTRLSTDTLQKCRAEGLCFHFLEKYAPGYKCNSPQFLLIADNESETNYTSDPLVLDDDTPPPIDQHQVFALSIASYFGLPSPQDLRISCHINKHPVSILINCGSTHNIIQPRLVSLFQLSHEPITEFFVMVGNSDNIQRNGLCPNLVVHVATTPFSITFLYFLWREHT